MGKPGCSIYQQIKTSFTCNQTGIEIHDEKWDKATSNFKLFFCVILQLWNLANAFTQPALKQHLLSASSNALRLLNNKSDLWISFEQLHRLHKRALPCDIMNYRLSIQLYKIYNEHILNEDWLDINFQQNHIARSVEPWQSG